MVIMKANPMFESQNKFISVQGKIVKNMFILLFRAAFYRNRKLAQLLDISCEIIKGLNQLFLNAICSEILTIYIG